MKDLFKAELARFRLWGIAYAIANLLVLGFLARLLDLAQQPLLVYRVIATVYALSGLLLGLYQLGGYRKPGTWLQLLHRPLPHWQVAIALLGAGALWLLLAVGLPLLLIAGWQEAMTARVVDLRHWLLPLAAVLIACCTYLAGAFCMLGGRRYAAAVLVVPALLTAMAASGWAALAVMALLLLWLLAMVLSAFKPALGVPARRPLAVVLTALPVQMATYLLLLLLATGVELLWIAQGSHPANGTPPAGGFTEAQNAEGADLLLAVLATSPDPDAPLWREQVPLSEVITLAPELRTLPERMELTNPAPMEFDDDEDGVRWVLSHDRMRFVGYRTSDRAQVGELGIGADNAPFATPVLPLGAIAMLPSGDSMLLGHSTLYQYNHATQSALPRIQLATGEVFAGSPTAVGASIAQLSNQALYLYDGRAVAEDLQLLVARQRVPLPGPIGSLSRIDLIERVDGYLMSFTFSTQAFAGQVDPYQVLLRVDDSGTVTTVARRALGKDFPEVYRYQAWWLSPAMHALRSGATQLFASAAPLQASVAPPVPRPILLLAAALCGLSLLAAIRLTGRRNLSVPARLGWIAACTVVGVPAVASLWLLVAAAEPVSRSRSVAGRTLATGLS